MTPTEATKYLIRPICSSTDPGEECQKQLEAYNMAKAKLTEEEKEPLKWEHVHGVVTPGGDPLVRCPVCKSRDSEHLIGIECHRRWKWCPVCGERLEE